MTDATPSTDPTPAESARMTFGEHLDELRSRMFRALAVVGVVFFGGWIFFQDQLIWLFMRPHRSAVESLASADPPVQVPKQLAVLSPLEDLFFTLKASLLVAVVLGLPFLIFQIWAFVSAGLHLHERKAVRRYLPWSFLLSIGGLCFCYFVFFPLVLGVWWKRANRQGAVAGMVCGLAAGCIYLYLVRWGGMEPWMGIDHLRFGIIGAAVSLVSMVVVTLATPEPAVEGDGAGA
mgnify:CR=1 FL=1